MKDYIIFLLLAIACFIVQAISKEDKETKNWLSAIGVMLLIFGFIAAFFEI